MLFNLIDGGCYPKSSVDVLVTLACIDGVLDILAFIQTNDDDDEEGSSPWEALLEKMEKSNSSGDKRRRCCSFRAIHVVSRQKVVILVYVDIFAIAMLLLGGALACYGLMLSLKMRNVISERAASEMWKVAGSSVPSAFVLWVMRELPPSFAVNIQEPRIIAFISDNSRTEHPQRWTAAASLQNQVSRASPI